MYIDNYLTNMLPRLYPDRLSSNLRWAPPGITIAIPNWNHEYVLPRSIKSALEAVKILATQEVCAEVLVIDDQSRDGSLTLLRQLEALYFEEGLRVLALPKNVGLGAVRNQALIVASYQYILFMDADNELVPENIHLFYRAIKDTDAAIIYGNLIHKDAEGRFIGLLSNESFQDRIMTRNYIDAFALYDRLQIFDMGGYVEGNFYMDAFEDWELVLHTAASGRKVIFVPAVLGIYHDLPGSLIKAAREELSLDFKRQAYLQRIFNQLGIREDQALNTKHLRYHPDVGYI